MLWFLLLVIIVVFFMLQQQSGLFNDSFVQTRVPNRTQNQSNALDILNERYARGELDTDEYESMKKNITT